jgi:CRP/FNR family transcriptional regulator, nitrogen fixation regulation protein
MEECMQFRPPHNRVGIKRIDAEEKPAGGIIIPDTAKEKSRQGENNTNHSAPALAYQPKRLEKLASIAVVRKCHRGQEICSQGQPAEYWYRVTSGTARRCVAQPDGRRQIVELLLPGDFFGFTALTEYDSTVEAVAEGTIVASYPRRRVEMLAEADPQLSREILQVTFEALSRLQAQLMILGRITATEKVSSFLLKMAGRLSDQTPDHVDLPISRYDIADYLGLSVETVSRSLTSLKNRGLIVLSGPRSVRIIDRDALEEGGAYNAYPKQLGDRRSSDNFSTHSSRAVRANIRSAERLSYLSRPHFSGGAIRSGHRDSANLRHSPEDCHRGR